MSIVFTIDAQNWDINNAKSINPENPHSTYWKAMSGSAYFLSAAAPIYFLTKGIIKDDIKARRKGYRILGSITMELIISELMKEGFNRKRPAESYPAEIFPYRNVTGRSFPSGHTSLVFATAASLSIECKKWYVVVPAYAYAGSVGYSRIYLGVHYPTDVIAGAAVGIGSAYLCHWLNKKIFPSTK
ncbi:phosphatase PAP2 family protein [Ferruginibacter profundus]